ncbi:MAG: hypothetical protein AUJ07_08130 [Crenarchaeota archaeon 13_1_40CM_3_53_5]|nr:MAG: hypothetical protein AUJ07_08130 [Crenarchaeota archaeon 13_1_40CM_3_53_5]
MLNDDPDEESRLIEETKGYYSQRAGQYFDWAPKTGDHEGHLEPNQSFFDEAKLLLDALDASRLVGKILEIACGTGVWTEAVIKNNVSEPGIFQYFYQPS